MATEVLAPATTETLEIVVTLDDIAQGVRGHAEQCAVAVALTRAGYGDVAVDNGRVCAGGRYWVMSPELEAWIHRFDWNHAPAPERFVLQPYNNNQAPR